MFRGNFFHDSVSRRKFVKVVPKSISQCLSKKHGTTQGILVGIQKIFATRHFSSGRRLMKGRVTSASCTWSGRRERELYFLPGSRSTASILRRRHSLRFIGIRHPECISTNSPALLALGFSFV